KSQAARQWEISFDESKLPLVADDHLGSSEIYIDYRPPSGREFGRWKLAELAQAKRFPTNDPKPFTVQLKRGSLVINGNSSLKGKLTIPARDPNGQVGQITLS